MILCEDGLCYVRLNLFRWTENRWDIDDLTRRGVEMPRKKSGIDGKTLHSITSDSDGFFEKQLKWLSAEEAAWYLRLPSVDVLRHLVSEKRITYYKFGRSLRFKVSDLDAQLEQTRILGRFT